MIRLTWATSVKNNTGAIIASFTSPTEVVAYQPSGVTEAFSGVWTINAYDNGQDASGNTHGSSHAIYIFGGRRNIVVDSCMFIGNRTCCVKISGTTGSLRNITVSNCFAEECASFVIAGADDVNEHTEIAVDNNRLIDCSIQRVGWNAGGCISFLGSRNVSATNNQFHWTRNSILSFQELGQGLVSGISAGRYVDGYSQPVEDLLVSGNKFTRDPSSTKSGSIIHTSISVSEVGIRAKYATAGSLTFSSPTVTLTDGNALFTQAEVGRTIQIVNSTGGNDGSFVITGASVVTWTIALALFNPGHVGHKVTLAGCTNIANNGIFVITSVISPTEVTFSNAAAVNETSSFTWSIDEGTHSTGGRLVSGPSKTTLTYTNPNGAAGSAGTYRIQAADLGGACIIANNQILSVGTVGISCKNNVGPEVTGNILSGLISNIQFHGDVSPRAVNNRVIGVGTMGATLRLSPGTSWPFVDDNIITNSAIGRSHGRDMGICVDDSMQVDYPLLGKRGRARPTYGHEEVVIAYGSQLVDGDTITVTAGGTVTYTFKATSPSNAANEFNTSVGLIGLIHAQAGADCADYGAGLSGNVATNHLRIRREVPTSGTDGTLKVSVSALNPTALVSPYNADPNTRCLGRGSGYDRTVIWSLACTWTGGVILWADNEPARTLLQANGWRPLKDPYDAGACEILIHGNAGLVSVAEFRWVIA